MTAQPSIGEKMTFWVAVRGTVQKGPETIEGSSHETVAAFVLADTQRGRYRDQEFALDGVSVCEVVLRGSAAAAVLDSLRPGDAVLALGLLRIAVPIGITEDADLVTLSIEAYSIGRDLAGYPPS